MIQSVQVPTSTAADGFTERGSSDRCCHYSLQQAETSASGLHGKPTDDSPSLECIARFEHHYAERRLLISREGGARRKKSRKKGFDEASTTVLFWEMQIQSTSHSVVVAPINENPRGRCDDEREARSKPRDTEEKKKNLRGFRLKLRLASFAPC